MGVGKGDTLLSGTLYFDFTFFFFIVVKYIGHETCDFNH